MRKWLILALFLGPFGIAGCLTPNDLASREMGVWRSIKDSRDHRDFEDYLNRYPDGVFTGLAQIRLERLRARHASGIDPNVTAAPVVLTDGRWHWELNFGTSTGCHGTERFSPLVIHYGNITSQFYHATAGTVVRVHGKVDKQGNVSMYGADSNMTVTMEGTLSEDSGGGRVDGQGNGDVCLGEWRAFR